MLLLGHAQIRISRLDGVLGSALRRGGGPVTVSNVDRSGRKSSYETYDAVMAGTTLVNVGPA